MKTTMIATPKLDALRALVGGTIFAATFVKRDGSIRTGTFRTGVRQGVNGVGLAYDPKERGNLIVWDTRAKAFRTIKMDRVVEIRARGERFKVESTALLLGLWATLSQAARLRAVTQLDVATRSRALRGLRAL